jgi:hypothetical protein
MKEELSVILNVYKLKEGSFLHKLGVTLYHTAIEYDNTEYAFGFINREKISGIYDIKPMSFNDGTYVESIVIGKASRRNFFVNLEKLKSFYLGNTYNFIMKNCNHFTNDISKILFNKDIPIKYRSFLKFGEFLRKIF